MADSNEEASHEIAIEPKKKRSVTDVFHYVVQFQLLLLQFISICLSILEFHIKLKMLLSFLSDVHEANEQVCTVFGDNKRIDVICKNVVHVTVKQQTIAKFVLFSDIR